MYEIPAQKSRGMTINLKIWENPIVWRQFKSRLRTSAILQCLLVLITAAFITLITYAGLDRFSVDKLQAARAGIIPLLILQGLILMLAGTGRVTSGIIHERVTGTLDYTRLAPMPPLRKVVGYLFGLPVREYVLFLITVPFMSFLLIQGQIPAAVIVPVYLVFFSSVLLYHLIGLVFGLVLKEWRMSVLFTQGVVILINLILPAFSTLGFPLLQYLSVRPVVAAKIYPYLPVSSSFREQGTEAFFSSNVAFFNLSISTTLFTLLLQGVLIFTLGLMVYRKWENAFNKSLGKLYAMGLFVGLQFFCIGTLWPNLVESVNSDLARGLLGTNISRNELAILLPLVFTYFSLFCVCWLLYIVTPTHDEYRSGKLLDRKLRRSGKKCLPLLNDKSSALVTAVVFAVATFVFIVFIQATFADTQYYQGKGLFSAESMRLAVAAVMITFYFHIALEALEIQKMGVLLVILWIVPVLLAILSGVAFGVELNWAYIAALSPIALVAFSILPLLSDVLASEMSDLFARAYMSGIACNLIITAYLGYRLLNIRKLMTQKLRFLEQKNLNIEQRTGS